MLCPLEMTPSWKTLLVTNLFPYWRNRSSGFLRRVARRFLHGVLEKRTAFVFRNTSQVTDPLPWRWRRYIPLTFRETIAQLHTPITHKTQFLISHEVVISKFCFHIHFWLFCLPHLLSLSVAYHGVLFGGFNKFSWGQRQRERGSGGGSPLVRVSGGSRNLVQEISFHIVKLS